MKKLITLITLTAVLMFAAIPVSAQGRYRFNSNCGYITHSHGGLTHRHYACRGDNHRHGRSFWQKHRDKLTVGIGAGAGVGIGALAGGRKGAVIGAIIGGGSSAIYTYGIRHRRRAARYHR